MITSQLNTYQIADFIDWYDTGQLVLNPDFQRRPVWTEPARVFLIDTILRELSIPKFYMRTTIDFKSKKSVREIVDGQQRLRAILDFANDKLKLTRRAGEFDGLTYSTLPEDLKETFLKYTLAVEHLINANDNDVLEVFSRLNSYGETLNEAEKRHAKFQGEFKWAVRNLASEYSSFWVDYSILGIRQRMRMADDELMAQLFGVFIDGIMDGGNPYINKLYSRFDEKFPNKKQLESQIKNTIDKLSTNFGPILKSNLGRGPQFLMLFAAVAHSLYGLDKGGIAVMPKKKAMKDYNDASVALVRLSDALDSRDEESLTPSLSSFRTAARSSTQRIKSREIRFKAIYSAITG